MNRTEYHPGVGAVLSRLIGVLLAAVLAVPALADGVQGVYSAYSLTFTEHGPGGFANPILNTGVLIQDYYLFGQNGPAMPAAPAGQVLVSSTVISPNPIAAGDVVFLGHPGTAVETASLPLQLLEVAGWALLGHVGNIPSTTGLADGWVFQSRATGQLVMLTKNVLIYQASTRLTSVDSTATLTIQ